MRMGGVEDGARVRMTSVHYAGRVGTVAGEVWVNGGGRGRRLAYWVDLAATPRAKARRIKSWASSFDSAEDPKES